MRRFQSSKNTEYIQYTYLYLPLFFSNARTHIVGQNILLVAADTGDDGSSGRARALLRKSFEL